VQLASATLLERFPRWAKVYRDEDGPRRLASDAVAVLVGFRLVEVRSGLVRPLPAAARYAIREVRTS
jgi:hypothetical protein